LAIVARFSDICMTKLRLVAFGFGVRVSFAASALALSLTDV